MGSSKTTNNPLCAKKSDRTDRRYKAVVPTRLAGQRDLRFKLLSPSLRREKYNNNTVVTKDKNTNMTSTNTYSTQEVRSTNSAVVTN